MTALRFAMIVLILLGVSVAWFILAGSISYRTEELKGDLSVDLDSLWGASGLSQVGPVVAVGDDRRDVDASDVNVTFNHENRYKGLLWFSTYRIGFEGSYTVETDTQAAGAQLVFGLPGGTPFFEDLAVTLDEEPLDVDEVKADQTLRVPLPDAPGAHTVAVRYKARGRDRWTYRPAAEGTNRMPRLRNFTLTATTDFREIDYPTGTISPTTKAEPLNAGMRATWRISDARTRQTMGIEMPKRQNAGPMAARMAFWAPVSLFFFFAVLFTVMLLKDVPLHPMHYLFLGAGFFAFHILMAYLVDHIEIEYAFAASAAVSLAMVVSYMVLVAGARFGVAYVGLAQLVYLVGFSAAFFLKGFTGLSVVIMAVLTLFVLMMATARVPWGEVFGRPARPTVPDGAEKAEGDELTAGEIAGRLSEKSS